MRILALDPATKCGWAHSAHVSGEWDLNPGRDDDWGSRLVLFVSRLNSILGQYGIEMVVYEAARHAAPKMQGALVRQAMIQGALVHWCSENGIAYRGYSPSQIKKRATGKGNASKAKVVAAALERWPELAGMLTGDNEADALWLLDLARADYAPSMV